MISSLMGSEQGVFQFNESVPAGFDSLTMSLVFLERLLPSLELSESLFLAVLTALSQTRFNELSKKIYQVWIDLPDKERLNSGVVEKDFGKRDSLASIATDIHFSQLNRNDEPGLQEILLDAINLSLEESGSPIAGSLKKFNKLIKTYQLSQVEIEAALFLYTIEDRKEFGELFDRLSYNVCVEVLTKSLNITQEQTLEIFSQEGRLFLSGLIDRPLIQGGIHETNIPKLTLFLREFISGVRAKDLLEKQIRRDGGKRYSLESFNLPDLRLEVVQGILATKNACNILLYGSAGTGKTEFARSLASSQSPLVFFFNLDSKVSFSHNSSRAELIAAHDRVSRENGILIIDEADNILQPAHAIFPFDMGDSSMESLGKEWINNFLDNCACRIIWITNRVRMLDPSVMRRFDFSLRFRNLDRKQRLAMWKCKLLEEKIRLPKAEVERFAAEYPVNSGLIASALKGCSTFKDDPKTLIPKLEEILERQLDLHGLNKSVDRSTICQGYDPSALCLDTERLVFEDSLLGFIKHLERNKKAGALNLLFWGPSGTGKTEYARYLAGLTGRELVFKRASDLKGCYVGETEKSIRAAFQEASNGGSILFIDEADSFLYTRNRARYSWEITAVNEFLTNMESFNGILICCTNLLSEFDRASLRRFQWKIGFKPLEAEGRVNLFRKYFSPRKKLALDLVAQLEALDGLVPGDFKSVRDRLSFAKPGRPIWEIALEELAKEIELRRGRREQVGFIPKV